MSEFCSQSQEIFLGVFLPPKITVFAHIKPLVPIFLLPQILISASLSLRRENSGKFSLPVDLSPSHFVPLRMADQGSTSQYVKLKKIQDAPAEDIQPGELNQPIRVPQLEVPKCHECGQPLPENFQPPADEAWTTDILGCAEDTESCWKGLFCPCVLFGQNVQNIHDDAQWTSACVCHAIFIEGGIALGAAMPMFYGIDPKTSCLIIEGLFFAWWMCAVHTSAFRQRLQKKYHLANDPCDPCLVHCCMHWCAICQEHREMKGRLSFNVELPTVVKPPAMQEMSANESPEAIGSGSGSTQQT